MEQPVLPVIERENVVNLACQALGNEREGKRRRIAVLRLAAAEVDAFAEQAAGSACLESSYLKSEFTEGVAETGSTVTHSPADFVLQPHMEQPAHEGARCDDDCLCIHAQPEITFDAARSVAVDQDADGVALFQVETRRSLQQRLGAELVSFLVALCSRRTDARTFPSIQHSELDARGIRIEPHHSAQRVDFSDHLTFRLPTDRRVAGHLTDGIKILCKHQRFAPKTSRSTRRLDPGVTGTDHDHIVGFWINEHAAFYVEQS